MHLIKPDININFVGMRYKAFMLSGAIILLGLITLFARGGLRMGVDFAGGTLIQVRFNHPTSPDQIRNALQGIISHGFIQQIGNSSDNEYMIRSDAIHEELGSLSNQVADLLNKAYGPGQQVLRVEMVGPKVGHDLRQKALHAIFYAFLFIAVYISWRFEFRLSAGLIMGLVMGLGIYMLDALGLNAVYLIGGALIITFVLCWFLKLPYALGALLSLVHDILITVGIFAFFNKEFSLEVFAALFDPLRLLAKRYHYRIRPDPRESQQGQEGQIQRNDKRCDKPDPEPDGVDLHDSVFRHFVPVPPGRQRYPRF